MADVMCCSSGAGVSVYDLLHFMLCALSCVLSMSVVHIGLPYLWARDVFSVSCELGASSRVNVFLFAFR